MNKEQFTKIMLIICIVGLYIIWVVEKGFKNGTITAILIFVSFYILTKIFELILSKLKD